MFSNSWFLFLVIQIRTSNSLTLEITSNDDLLKLVLMAG